MNAHVVSLRSMGLNCYPLSDRIDISSVASSGSALVSLECENIRRKSVTQPTEALLALPLLSTRSLSR